jgi:hypothetical protein
MLELKVKKAILETKEKKEKLLIEQTLIKKRILMIFESEKNIKNFDSLPKFKKEKIAYKLVSEINFLVETNLLNEQLTDFLGKIFGNNLTGVFQTIVNPMVVSLMKSLELADYFKESLISSISSDPTKLSQALRSCDELSKLIAESLSDAIHNRIVQKTGTDSVESKFLNSALSDAVKDPRFSENVQRKINSVVCDLFSVMSDKASKVYDKLKPSEGEIGGLFTP